MATKYVDSIGGDDTTGDSWATAYATLQQGLTGAGAGGLVYIEDNHSETPSGLLTLTSSGTPASPTQVICASSADTSLSTGALVGKTTGATTFVGYCWVYGVTFKTKDDFRLESGSSYWRFEQCLMEFDHTSVRDFTIGASGNGQYVAHFVNTDVKFGATTQFFLLNSGKFLWEGGAVDSAGSAPAVFAKNGSRSTAVIIRDVDLSHISGNLMEWDTAVTGTVEIQNCKLHASVTPLSGSVAQWGQSLKLHRCDSANNTYEFQEELYQGTNSQDTSIYLNATDGTTPLSIKMVTNANSLEEYSSLSSPPITAWTDSVSSTTFTVELAIDSATTLNDDDVWIEWVTPGSDAQGVKSSSRMAPLGTPSELTTSSASWTGLGGSPKKYKISRTVTPGKAGLVTAVVHSAKPSTTIYADPYITEA
jgi:hypothetical protein